MKNLYLLHKTMQRWMYCRSRTPMAKFAARITAINMRSRCKFDILYYTSWWDIYGMNSEMGGIHPIGNKTCCLYN